MNKSAWLPSDMRSSFVYNIWKQKVLYDPNETWYFRGPSWFDNGVRTTDIVRSAYAWVTAKRKESKTDKISMAGWSRGAAACIAVAKLLKQDNAAVEYLAMFDAVQRSSRLEMELSIDTSDIPANVKVAYHAVRSDTFGSRVYFGHTGRIADPCSTRYEEAIFEATHAALGGLPCTGDQPQTHLERIEHHSRGDRWIYTPFNCKEDIQQSRNVWAWMKPRIDSAGFFS